MPSGLGLGGWVGRCRHTRTGPEVPPTLENPKHGPRVAGSGTQSALGLRLKWTCLPRQAAWPLSLVMGSWKRVSCRWAAKSVFWKDDTNRGGGSTAGHVPCPWTRRMSCGPTSRGSRSRGQRCRCWTFLVGRNEVLTLGPQPLQGALNPWSDIYRKLNFLPLCAPQAAQRK